MKTIFIDKGINFSKKIEIKKLIDFKFIKSEKQIEILFQDEAGMKRISPYKDVIRIFTKDNSAEYIEREVDKLAGTSTKWKVEDRKYEQIEFRTIKGVSNRFYGWNTSFYDTREQARNCIKEQIKSSIRYQKEMIKKTEIKLKEEEIALREFQDTKSLFAEFEKQRTDL